MVRERKEYKVVELIHRRRLSHGDGSLGHDRLFCSAPQCPHSGCPQAMGVPLQHTWSREQGLEPTIRNPAPSNQLPTTLTGSHPPKPPILISGSPVRGQENASWPPLHLLLSGGMIGVAKLLR